ncbi:MAG TPA: hypothetical protein VL463_25635 [Kofleriaceae bacterium]|nr:hypothetical protein [Kofleriaceae bacterium]
MRGVFVTFLVAVFAAPARADLPPLDPSGSYAIDLYGGAALGSARIVGMGGAAVASAEGSAGTVANPAAAAVRPATSTTSFDWDWHLDGQSAVYASDLDNNGRDAGGGARLATFGILFDWREWAFAAVGTTQSTELDGGRTATTTRARVAIARTFGDEAWTFGAAVDAGSFDLAQAGVRAFSIGGAALSGGAVYRQPRGDWRAGIAASLPVTGTQASNGCGADRCGLVVLPTRVEAPWQLGVGVAWRHGEQAWNQWVAGDFRDERAITVALDLIVTGGVSSGYGLEAFGEGFEQRSGSHAVASVRGGAEWECVPGHVRVRGGAYWEPGRFADVGGRPHVTIGLEGGALQFELWGRRRLRMSLTADLAPRYGTASVSVGFWH